MLPDQTTSQSVISTQPPLDKLPFNQMYQEQQLLHLTQLNQSSRLLLLTDTGEFHLYL